MPEIIELLSYCERAYDHAGIIAGPDGIDGASASTLPSGETLIVFRGTLANHDGQSVIDWIQDLHADLVAADGFAGRVHAGFLAALNALLGDIMDALEGNPAPAPPVKTLATRLWERLFDRPANFFETSPLPWNKKLIITGHSKGGALAQMAGVRLQHLRPKVICFAAPLWTDADGARNYPSGVDVTLYQSAGDLVPHVPPFGYAQMSEAEVISQQFPGYPPQLQARALQMQAHGTMADLLDPVKRKETWAKVTAAHGIATGYRPWLSQLPSEPAAQAA